MFITTVCQVAREALEHLGVLKDKAVEAQPELAVSLSPSRGVLVLGPDFKHWTRLQAPDLKKRAGDPNKKDRSPGSCVQGALRQGPVSWSSDYLLEVWVWYDHPQYFMRSVPDL